MSLIDHYAADMDWTELYDGRDVFDPIECAECAGSGLYRRATWAEPEEPCPHCDGTGLIDCNCPSRCELHDELAARAERDTRPLTYRLTDPWRFAQPLEPPF